MSSFMIIWAMIFEFIVPNMIFGPISEGWMLSCVIGQVHHFHVELTFIAEFWLSLILPSWFLQAAPPYH